MSTTQDPAPILLALPSFTPSLALEVIPRGVTLHRLFVQADGRTHDILVGPENPTDHAVQKYTNTLVGRYANRLPVSPATLTRNGLTSTFAALPNESPSVSLHGGPIGFDSLPWTPIPLPYFPSAQDEGDARPLLFTNAELETIQSELQTSVLFYRISEDGEQGFPGKLRVEALVGLVDPRGPATGEEYPLGSVVIVYRARLEEEGKVTPINLTQHWGFNLDASLKDGPESLSVKDHKLTIKADHTIALTETGLSTGELAPVAGTHHAHAEKKTSKIGESFPEKGYDEFYLFSRPAAPIPTRLPASAFQASGTVGVTSAEGANVLKEILKPREQTAEPLVSLESEKSGLKLVFDTNQSGVQFYSNNLTSPEKNARKKIHGGSGVFGAGDGYGVGTAAFLEFHEPLAAWLHPATLGASGDDTLLASGEVYNNYVKMDVWYKSPASAASQA
ncbi:hypothetical protein PHLCEN_2v10445 [Hermanssonia centrifuga]|uniref:Galactose mutarotase-like protein n=1 Tax=Hermanssonia centrifuga TaxID=98765 RepID=A0A2R6NMY4_9APHY|nr:hypothetical protein PHLCEN_2v10445 [Hermanssonia centrifuga]